MDAIASVLISDVNGSELDSLHMYQCHMSYICQALLYTVFPYGKVALSYQIPEF